MKTKFWVTSSGREHRTKFGERNNRRVRHQLGPQRCDPKWGRTKDEIGGGNFAYTSGYCDSSHEIERRPNSRKPSDAPGERGGAGSFRGIGGRMKRLRRQPGGAGATARRMREERSVSLPSLSFDSVESAGGRERGDGREGGGKEKRTDGWCERTLRFGYSDLCISKDRLLLLLLLLHSLLVQT